jgi:hypothetical protein
MKPTRKYKEIPMKPETLKYTVQGTTQKEQPADYLCHGGGTCTDRECDTLKDAKQWAMYLLTPEADKFYNDGEPLTYTRIVRNSDGCIMADFFRK